MGQDTILVTGGSGFLGWNIARELAARGYRVKATYHRRQRSDAFCEWIFLDLNQYTQFTELLGMGGYSAIVHAAAIADPRACEQNRSLAFRVNTVATRHLAQYASEYRIPFFFISTDLVFDGKKGAYTESDPVSPATYYAETKCFAEQDIRLICSSYHILRTSLMYGESASGPGAFLSWVLDGLRKQRDVSLYTNQYRTPLYAPDVARAILHLLESDLPSDDWHLGGPQKLNRYEMGIIIADVFGYPTDKLIPTLVYRDGELGAKDDCSLDSEKIQTCTGIRFTGFREGLELVRRGLKERKLI